MSSVGQNMSGMKIEHFGGDLEEWPPWRVKFRSLCSRETCLSAILKNASPRPAAAGDAQNAWDELSEKVYTVLSLHTNGIAGRLVAQFDETRNGVEAWKMLEAKYELKGDEQINALQERFHANTLQESEDPDIYFADQEEIQLRLKSLEVTVDNSSLKAAAMRAMPEVYGPLRVILRTTPGLTYDDFKDRVRGFYRDEILTSKKANAALAAEFKGQCHNCKEFGHKQFECKKPKKADGKDKRKFRGTCRRCHKYGHRDSDCRVKPGNTANAATHKNVTFVATEAKNMRMPGKDWVMDSGCSTHMTQSRKGLTGFRDEAGEVSIASGDKVASVGVGNLQLHTTDINGHSTEVLLKDVLVVPKIARSLLSVRKINNAGGSVRFEPGKARVAINNVEIPIRQDGNLFVLDLEPGAADAMHAEDVSATAKLWHGRLGHRNYADLRKLGELDVGVPKGLSGDGKCDVCEITKHSHTSFKRDANRSVKAPFELVHTDVVGPMDMQSIGGHKYAIGFTDERTRYRKVYFLKHKSEALACFQQYIEDLSGTFRGQKVKTLGLHSDGGGEFVGGLFKKFCKQQGIRQTFSGPRTPQQNGIAERSWRTILNTVRAMLRAAGLSRGYWAEAMNTAVYLLNRVPTASLGGGTPYNALYGKEAPLDHLRIFGCRAYAHVYDGERKKLDDKAWEGIMVGYDDSNRSCYRIYNPITRQTRSTVHVTFDEGNFPAKPGVTASSGDLDDDHEQEPVGDTGDTNNDVDEDAESEDSVGESKSDRTQPRAQPGASVGASGWKWTDDVVNRGDSLGRSLRSSRARVCPDSSCTDEDGSGDGQPTASFSLHHAFAVNPTEADDLAVQCALSVDASVAGDPRSYNEAMRSAEADLWKEAVKAEYTSLKKAETWDLCKLPKGKTLIGSRWVFKRKRDQNGQVVRYKARFVAQGFSQEPGKDFFDTYAPVAKMSSIRTILAIAALEDWELQNMDVNTAFLQSPVDEEIYVKQPQGFEELGPMGVMLVCRMLKSLYGLRQASRNWNKVIDRWLRKFGFTPSAADPCVYVLADDKNGILVVVLYVDDLMIAGNKKATVEHFKRAIADRFDMKDLGDLQWMLGMQVTRDRKNRTLEISQKAYIEQVLERFGMANCKSVATPAEGVLMRLTDDDKASTDREYMSLVGSLLYAAIVTRPDIAFAVQSLGRHLQRSGAEHWIAAKRVLRYLQGTISLGIMYGKNGAHELDMIGYCDADWGGDRDTRRSTTAYVFMLAGGSITWASKLQPTVALSSSEAEYMAVSAAVQDAIYMRQLLSDLGYPQDHPTVIFEDNQGCIALSENPVMHKRTKHIDMRHHFIRERVESKEIALQYVATEHQLADLLTKPLMRLRTIKMRDVILGYKEL